MKPNKNKRVYGSEFEDKVFGKEFSEGTYGQEFEGEDNQ